jgi:DNA uptake protein ComE-like DNA-binding protein
MKIGGFVNDIQLKDIYGLDYEVEERLMNQFTVKDTTSVKKLNINTANLAQLSEIPYFDYELARKIRDYRIVNEGIETFEELAKIEAFPAHQIERIKLYLTLETTD